MCVCSHRSVFDQTKSSQSVWLFWFDCFPQRIYIKDKNNQSQCCATHTWPEKKVPKSAKMFCFSVFFASLIVSDKTNRHFTQEKHEMLISNFLPSQSHAKRYNNDKSRQKKKKKWKRDTDKLPQTKKQCEHVLIAVPEDHAHFPGALTSVCFDQI